MKIPHFFGYGSLVNTATHDYPNTRHATASGWRRRWVHTADRKAAYLTAIRSPGSQITGLIAEVPRGDWAALDLRESGYERLLDTDNVSHAGPAQADVAIYAVSPGNWAEVRTQNPILLSYLDVVLQGYLQEFGATGAQDFITTTDGWDAPILNDRAAPLYPRHQSLDATETQFVDAALAQIGVTITDA